MILIIWAFIWFLGIMLGINCIRLGAGHLLSRRELPASCQRATACLVMARTFGISLVLLGLLLIYAVCAPIAELPGYAIFKHIFLM
jgi:hypothetical protein